MLLRLLAKTGLRNWSTILGLACLGLFPAWSQKLSGQNTSSTIGDGSQWIAQLGSGDFQTREKASDRLRSMGPEVLPLLRNAMKNPDAEIRKRAGDLLGELEKREWTRKALAPQLITLKLNQANASEALAEFSKVSGMRIDFADPRDRLGTKRLDLALEKVSVWEALRLIKVGFDLREKVEVEQEEEPGDPNMWRRRPSRTARGYLEPAPFRIPLIHRPSEDSPDWENTDLGVRVSLGKNAAGYKLTLHSQTDARILNLRSLTPKSGNQPGEPKDPKFLAWKYTAPSPPPNQQRRGAMIISSLSRTVPARQDAVLELLPGGNVAGCLAGTAQIDLLQIDRPLIRIDDLGDSEGKSFEGRDGLKIEVKQALEIRPGNFQVRFQVYPPVDAFGPPIAMAVPLPGIPAPGNPKPAAMPGLPLGQGPLFLPTQHSINPAEFRFSLDGRVLSPAGSGVSTTVNARGTTHEVTFTFQSRALDGLAGVSVEWISQNVVSLEVPFEFKDISVP